jgi:hypothetical protein
MSGIANRQPLWVDKDASPHQHCRGHNHDHDRRHHRKKERAARDVPQQGEPCARLHQIHRRYCFKSKPRMHGTPFPLWLGRIRWQSKWTWTPRSRNWHLFRLLPALRLHWRGRMSKIISPCSSLRRRRLRELRRLDAVHDDNVAAPDHFPRTDRGDLIPGSPPITHGAALWMHPRSTGIWPVDWLCEQLGVSHGGFYAWLTRPRSARSRNDEEVGAKVRASFLASDQTYGARRVWKTCRPKVCFGDRIASSD